MSKEHPSLELYAAQFAVDVFKRKDPPPLFSDFLDYCHDSGIEITDQQVVVFFQSFANHYQKLKRHELRTTSPQD